MTDIAVLGAGFSGTLLVVNLLAQSGAEVRVHWWGRTQSRGRGIAYNTPCRAHVLNVPAQNMGAFPREPGHFLDWLQREAPERPRDELRDVFAPRADYARYLQTSTAAAFLHAEAEGRLLCYDAEATDVAPGEAGRLDVYATGRPPVPVDRAALCIGHFAPRMPPVEGREHLTPPHFVASPWDYTAIAAVPRRATVAALGAGLSMVDVALQLHDQGFAGQLVAFSRHGLLPRSHVTRPTPITLPPPPVDGLTARSLLHWLRAQIAVHAAHGGDWRQVLDAVRPHTVQTWRALPGAEQARVLRHGKSLWDVHRHRIAPEVGQLLARLRHQGTLLHHAGRLAAVEPGAAGRGLRLHWRLRHGGQPWRQHVDVLINCTGAHAAWTRSDAALPRALLARGAVRPGPHHLGLQLRPDGAVVDGAGKASERLFAMGPARLGIDFESVAVPELRGQAEALASRLLETRE